MTGSICSRCKERETTCAVLLCEVCRAEDPPSVQHVAQRLAQRLKALEERFARLERAMLLALRKTREARGDHQPSPWSMFDAIDEVGGQSGPLPMALQEIMMDIARIGKEARSERTREGLRRAALYGTKTGRPLGRPRRMSLVDEKRVSELSAEGRSLRSIAKETKIPRQTIHRYLAGKEQTP